MSVILKIKNNNFKKFVAISIALKTQKVKMNHILCLYTSQLIHIRWNSPSPAPRKRKRIQSSILFFFLQTDNGLLNRFLIFITGTIKLR